MTFAIQSPKIENPLCLIRLLKGAPLSVLTLLCMAKSAGMEAVEAKWLAQYSNYSDKPITQALAWLEEFGLVARTSAGWQLTVDPRQLPLLTFTAAQDPAPAPDQPDKPPQMPPEILPETPPDTPPDTPPESENFRSGNAQSEIFRLESCQQENFLPKKIRSENFYPENFRPETFWLEIFRPSRSSSSSSLRDSSLDSRKEILLARSRPEQVKISRKKFRVLSELYCLGIHQLARSRLARTRQLVDMLTAEKNRLSSAPSARKPRIQLDRGENPKKTPVRDKVLLLLFSVATPPKITTKVLLFPLTRTDVKKHKFLVKRYEFYSLCYSDDT